MKLYDQNTTLLLEFRRIMSHEVPRTCFIVMMENDGWDYERE